MRFESIFYSKWYRSLTIVVAGMAAHAGCLQATLGYLDDSWQIYDSDYVEGGQWWAEPAKLLTNLSYYLTWRCAGFSAFAFHLGNLALHILTALAIYWLARYLLATKPGTEASQWETVAWVAGLIFVVHPLTSEITNYARARDHGLVGLFSFLTAGFTMLAMRRGLRWAPAIFLAILGAAFSKGPGLPHAVLNCAIVTAAFSASERWRALVSNRAAVYAVVAATVVTLGLVFTHLAHLFRIVSEQISTREFFLSALNQSRVLPQYLWRMVLPIRLCSDHLIPQTRSFSDLEACIAQLGVVVLVGAVVFLWRKQLHPWALLTTLALASLLLRWLYITTELMVEYRTYPAMPFIAMLMAVAFYRWQQYQPRFAGLAAAALILVCVLLSQARSRDWHSAETLSAQVLRMYPLQLRAVNELSENELHAGHYEAVIQRYPEFLRRFNEVLAFNRANGPRWYQNWSLWAVEQYCALDEAVAHARSPSLAMENHNQVAWQMNENQIVHPVLWAQWHFTAGKIAALAGDRKSALSHLAAARRFWVSKLAVDREILKICPECSPDAL